MILQFNIEDKYGYYLDKVSPEEIIDFAKKNGFKYLVVFARDGWGRSFYRSKFYPLHEKLKEDMIEKLRILAEKEGIKLVLMVCHTSNKYLCKKYPNIAQKDKDGNLIYLDTKFINEVEWPLSCLNSIFKDICLLEIEEAKKYTKYLMLDSFRYQPDLNKQCFCENCKRVYREEFGEELVPLDYPNEKFFRQWFWRYDVVIRRLKEIKEKNKDIILIYNSHPAGWNWRNNTIVEYGREYIDVVFAEASEEDFQPLGFLSEITKLSKGLSKKDVWTSRNLFHLFNTPYLINKENIYINSFEIVFSGGIPLFTLFLSNYSLNKDKINIKDVNEDIQLAIETLNGYEPYKEVAIVFSNRTKDYIGYSNVYSYVEEVRGMFYALYNNNYQIEFVGERDIKDLWNFKAIILPNFASMTEKEAKLIKKVSEEKSIVATYLTSLYDGYTPRDNFLLSSEFGCDFVGLQKTYSFYVDNLVFPNTLDISDVVKVKPRSTAKIAHKIFSGAYEIGYEYIPGVAPAPKGNNVISYITSEKITYFPFQLGRYIFRYGYNDYERLLIDSLKIDPIVQSYTNNVRVFVFQDRDSIALGIINYNVNQRLNSYIPINTSFLEESFFSVAPIKKVTCLENVKIKVNDEFSEAESIFSNQVIIEKNNKSTFIKVKSLRYYDLVILR